MAPASRGVGVEDEMDTMDMAPAYEAWGVRLDGDRLSYEGGLVVRVHPRLLPLVRAELDAVSADRGAPWTTVVALSLGTMGRRSRPYRTAGCAWWDTGGWPGHERAYGSQRILARRPWPLPAGIYPAPGSLP